MSSKMTPTAEQAFAIECFNSGESLRLNAFAGTGKTSTLVAMADQTNRSGICIMYNKRAAQEAVERFSSNVRAKTVHGLAFSEVVGLYGVPKMTGTVSSGLIRSMLPNKPRSFGGVGLNDWQWAAAVKNTLSRFLTSSDDNLDAEHVEVSGRLRLMDPNGQALFIAAVLADARMLWARMQDAEDAMPMGHDGYLKAWALTRPEIYGDFIMLDEAQDTVPVVMKVFNDQQTQRIAVGDRWQNLYAWRGTQDAMSKLTFERTAYLSESFRFGPQIAAAGSEVLALLGETRALTGLGAPGDVVTDAPDANIVLFRTNANLLGAVLGAITDGITPFVEGGVDDILKVMDDVEKLQKGMPVLTPGDFFGFKNWREVVGASEDDEGLAKIVRLVDNHGVRRLRSVLSGLPSRADQADRIFSTAHKSKGLQWDSVQLHTDMLPISRTRDNVVMYKSWETINAELMLTYVAFTRAKKVLGVPAEVMQKLATLRHLKADEAVAA